MFRGDIFTGTPGIGIKTGKTIHTSILRVKSGVLACLRCERLFSTTVDEDAQNIYFKCYFTERFYFFDNESSQSCLFNRVAQQLRL